MDESLEVEEVIAISDYGLHLTDTSPTLSINAEDTKVIELNTPYHFIGKEHIPAWWGEEGIFRGRDNITFDIPWERMQVVQPHDTRQW